MLEALERIMDLKIIRMASWKKIDKMGLPINPNLPELGEVRIERTEKAVVNRLMCMLAVAAASYGFPRNQAIEWINQEGLKSDIEEYEQQFLDTGKGDLNRFKVQIEGMWALAWSLQIIQDLDFEKNCPNNFVAMLPDLKKKEPTMVFRSRAHLREKNEIISICDFAYCLHWVVRHTKLESKKNPLKLQPFVVPERRRALDWLILMENWYEVPLDT